MVLTFSVVLLGLLAVFRPLQKNAFYMLHAGLVIGAAYVVENFYFRVTPFAPKTFLLFLAFHLVSINIVTFIAYGVDKNAAKKGAWRISEMNLHTMELLGGWTGALLGQKVFRHKTKKKSYRTSFWLILVLQVAVVFAILRFLGIV